MNGRRSSSPAPGSGPGAEVTGAEVTGAEVTGAKVTSAEVMGAEATGAEVTGVEPEPSFAAGIVEHVRVVTSLIEGFEVSREEVLEMLARVLRQHRMGKEKRMDQAVHRLGREPP